MAIKSNQPTLLTKFCGRFRPPTTRWHQRSKTGGGAGLLHGRKTPISEMCTCISITRETQSPISHCSTHAYNVLPLPAERGTAVCVGTPFLWILASHISVLYESYVNVYSRVLLYNCKTVHGSWTKQALQTLALQTLQVETSIGSMTDESTSWPKLFCKTIS